MSISEAGFSLDPGVVVAADDIDAADGNVPLLGRRALVEKEGDVMVEGVWVLGAMIDVADLLAAA
jgi:hypothetical protein